jgi:divalent metal cation (Fe/Co/Zn/Cd) transporter
LLIGESASRYAIDGIRSMLKAHAATDYANEVLAMHMGPDFVLANISVDFQDHLTAEVIETAVAETDMRIKKKYPQIKRFFIEGEKRRNRIIAQLKKH